MGVIHQTDVDTEVIANLIARRGDMPLVKAIEATSRDIRGSYALVVLVAACTTLPVIGLPIQGSFMDGLDSLLSMVQMPSGIPVATVAVNGSDNAALLAISILSVEDQYLAEKLDKYREKMAQDVLEADRRMKEEL